MMVTRMESFFDSSTMSVHLKENVRPVAKKGSPGSWSFEFVAGGVLSRADISIIHDELLEAVKYDPKSFIEFSGKGSSIIQMGMHRIVVTQPPLSEGWEITAVRPVRQLSFDDYSLSDKLRDRIGGNAEGILIAGPPGAGKTTFAAALACFYSSAGRIVKTVEAPRDLVLPDSITQYSLSHGSRSEIQDILLLSRPDYTVFDEMRNTDDFSLFSDLRLSGIGMLGVIHATSPIDAIQRFVGRVELGIIPHVVDTVIFVKGGKVSKVLGLKMSVKVPSGMAEADLARPVIEVFDFESGVVEYEFYSYGDQAVAVPVSQEVTPVSSLAARHVSSIVSQYTPNAEVEVVGSHKCVVRIPESEMASLIGPKGKVISRIERAAGMSIELVPVGSRKQLEHLEFSVSDRGNSIVLSVGEPGILVDAFAGGSFLFTSMSSKKGEIKVKADSDNGKSVSRAIKLGSPFELRKSEFKKL